MVDTDAVYGRLPVPLQHAACSLQGWRLRRRYYGREFAALLAAAEERTFTSPADVAAYRDRRVRGVVGHCARTVPFYRRRFRELGLAPEDIRTAADLAALPPLTRAEAQAYAAELVSETVPSRQRLSRHTGGTTGAGLGITTTVAALREQEVYWWRFRRWHGIEPGTWCGYFGGRPSVPRDQTRPPFWRLNYPGRQVLFSPYHMSAANLGAYIGELRRRRPPWIHGWPSALTLLAAAVVEGGAELGYELRWLTTGGETLLPQQAELLEHALGLRPRQRYFMTEAVASISECERGSLHVDEDFAAVEFLPNPDGPGHRIIGTNLANEAQPLLRYDVQDVVTLAEDGCPCARPGRVVASIDGRTDDYIMLENGILLGRMTRVFRELVHIREAQIHQSRPGELTIRVVPGPGYTEADEAALLRETRRRVGEKTTVAIEYVERLSRSRSGKLRLVVSDIPEGQLERAAEAVG